MIKLYEREWEVSSKSEALAMTSSYTGFDKNDFKCEVVKEPKRVGLFKKEDGIYHCWYEYQGMDSDKELRIADTILHLDTTQKKILVLRSGFKAYEIEYDGLIDYELVISSSARTYTISNGNKALKGAVLFGLTGAVVGAADSTTISGTAEMNQLIIRLKFKGKESFEILTCHTPYDATSKLWRDILDESKEIDEYFKELLKTQ